MNCYVVRFLTLYEVLGLRHRRVMYVTLERRIGNDLPQNDTTNFVGFRVPFDMVAALECLGHSGFLSEPISGQGSLPLVRLQLLSQLEVDRHDHLDSDRLIVQICRFILPFLQCIECRSVQKWRPETTFISTTFPCSSKTASMRTWP